MILYFGKKFVEIVCFFRHFFFSFCKIDGNVIRHRIEMYDSVINSYGHEFLIHSHFQIRRIYFPLDCQFRRITAFEWTRKTNRFGLWAGHVSIWIKTFRMIWFLLSCFWLCVYNTKREKIVWQTSQELFDETSNIIFLHFFTSGDSRPSVRPSDQVFLDLKIKLRWWWYWSIEHVKFGVFSENIISKRNPCVNAYADGRGRYWCCQRIII